MMQDRTSLAAPGPGEATVKTNAVMAYVARDESLHRAARRLTHADVVRIQWLLRIACAGEFIGHGAFGLITKAAWLPYFGVVGIPPSIAYQLMPLIGLVDISMGLLVLVRPVRAALLYMAIWGLATATIRPVSGEPIWEWVERIPNFCVPFAFLYLRGFGKSLADWRR